MKYLAVAVLAILLVQVSSEEDKFKLLVGECIKSSGVDPKVVEDAFQNKIVKDDDPKLKEFLGCFFIGSQFANPDGSVNYDAVISQSHLFNFVAVENRKAILESCRDKNFHGSTFAETALLNFKCYVGLL